MEFKFLQQNNTYSGIELSQDVVDTIYEFCNNSINHENKCLEDFLRVNPHIDRSGRFSYTNIPLPEQVRKFPEGRLTYIDVDYDEEPYEIIHGLHFTLRELTDDFQRVLYLIEVTQDHENENRLRIKSIEVEYED
jgi:hypothetical protein